MTSAALETGYSRADLRRALISGEIEGHMKKQRWMMKQDSFQLWLAGRPSREKGMVPLTEFCRERGVVYSVLYNAMQRDEFPNVTVTRPGGCGTEVWLRCVDGEAWLADSEEYGLGLTEAAARFCVHKKWLEKAARSGRLPARRRGTRYRVKARDVEAFLRNKDRSQDRAWTKTRLLAMIGLGEDMLRPACKAGRLKPHLRRGPTGPRRLEFNLDELVPWLLHECPPYAPEVAHLPTTLTVEQVVDETQLSREDVLNAISSYDLLAVPVDPDTWIVARFELDRWLESRGLPTTRLISGERWLTVKRASDLTGRTVGEIVNTRRLTPHLVHVGGQGFRLVERTELLAWAAAKKIRSGLSVQEAAQLTGYSKDVIKDAAKSGTLTSTLTDAGYDIPPDALQDWAAGRRAYTLKVVAAKLQLEPEDLLQAIDSGQLQALPSADGTTWLVKIPDAHKWNQSRKPRP
jgi:excisionase family DNA binding protein